MIYVRVIAWFFPQFHDLFSVKSPLWRREKAGNGALLASSITQDFPHIFGLVGLIIRICFCNFSDSSECKDLLIYSFGFFINNHQRKTIRGIKKKLPFADIYPFFQNEISLSTGSKFKTSYFAGQPSDSTGWFSQSR